MKTFTRLVFNYNSVDMYKMLIYKTVTYISIYAENNYIEVKN